MLTRCCSPTDKNPKAFRSATILSHDLAALSYRAPAGSRVGCAGQNHRLLKRKMGTRQGSTCPEKRAESLFSNEQQHRTDKKDSHWHQCYQCFRQGGIHNAARKTEDLDLDRSITDMAVPRGFRTVPADPLYAVTESRALSSELRCELLAAAPISACSQPVHAVTRLSGLS